MNNKITFSYQSEEGINITINTDEDCTLKELMAYFIHFTNLIGYQSGSWENLLNELAEEDNQFIYDWASDCIYAIRS